MSGLIIQDNRIIPHMDELTKGFTKEEVDMLKALLEKNPGNELDVLKDLMGYTYRHVPVGVGQFVEDPYYLGLRGQVFPRLLDDLEELFEGDYVEAILTGAIGLSK